MKWLKQIYLNNFFFYVFAGIVTCFILSYFFPALYNASWLLLYIYLAFIAIDFLLLFSNSRFTASRIIPEKLSNGDENAVTVKMESGYSFPINVKVIDEIPFQFQERNFRVMKKLGAGKSDAFEY